MFFTELEKMNFLQKRGYKIKEETHEIGDYLSPEKVSVWVASKKGYKAKLETAFHRELKNKLLNE